MTDKAWERVIVKTVRTFEKYKELLDEAEIEYVKRYGHHPSEVDDDWWIDLMHCGQGNVDIEAIKRNAELR